MLPSTTLLRRAFVDVCNGYSVGRLGDQTVYIRHLSHREHTQYEDVEEGFKATARALGAQTETERLQTLYSKGLWYPQRETDIQTQRDRIGRMEEGRRTIAVPSILRSHEEAIGRERDALVKSLTERARIIGETVETDAARRLEDYYLIHNLFIDKGLTTLLYDDDTFNALEDDAIHAIHTAYGAAIDPCSDTNLRRLAVQDFFVSYWTLASDNPQAFYGRPVCELTYYQVRLAGQARYMKALLDNTDLNRLTPDKRADPDAIEQLHITQKNAAQMASEGKTPVGLSSQDIKETGQRFDPLPPPNLSGVELVKWMQKSKAMGPR